MTTKAQRLEKKQRKRELKRLHKVWGGRAKYKAWLVKEAEVIQMLKERFARDVDDAMLTGSLYPPKLSL